MRPEGPVIRKAEWFVSGCTMRQLHEMIGREHYARRGSITATYRFGLYRKADSFCGGVSWWIPPARGAASGTWDGDWKEVIAPHRLACHSTAPKNAASFLIARSIEHIRKDGRYKCLVTYADTAQGHTGAIYRATGWEYMGLTKPESAWVDSDGIQVSRLTAGRGRTLAEMAEAGLEKVGSYSRHKFRMILP